MLFGHGDDFYDIAQHIKINYSSNVWYGAELTPLKNHIYQTFEQISRYPEPDAASLRQTLAEAHGISPDNLLVTNGSITAFYLIAEAWQGSIPIGNLWRNSLYKEKIYAGYATPTIRMAR